MSTYRLDSEISLFNQMPLNENVNISAGFAEVINRSTYWSKLTSGAFDISILPLVLVWRKGKNLVDNNRVWEPPEHQDIIEAMSKIGYEKIKFQKLSNFMVEIGGEVRALGLNNKASSWKIGIDKPSENNQPGVDIVAIISLDDKAMATSGNYRNFFEFDGEKYSHIIDPRNGKSTQSSVVSVSVLGPNCMDGIFMPADIYKVETG